MDRKYILAGTLFILTTIIGIVFVFPKYRAVTVSSQTLSDKRAEQEKQNITIASITRIYDSYKKSSQDIGRIEYLLPIKDTQSIPKLFIEMEGLASQSGIFLNTISFRDENSGASVKSNDSAQAVKEYKKITIFINAKGDYNSIKSFGDAIENNEHLMDIASLSIVSSHTSKGGSAKGKSTSGDTGQTTKQDKADTDLTYVLVINTYYQ